MMIPRKVQISDTPMSDNQNEDVSTEDVQEETPFNESEDSESETTEENDSSSEQEEGGELSRRQKIMYNFFELVAERMGKWSQDSSPDGAHYMDKQPFGDKGIKCLNCAFFQGGNRCEIVDGEILPDAVCKLWIIRGELVKE